MSIGFVPPAGPGGFPWFMGEPFSGDPTVSPGLARPIGWEVRRPDGTGAWFKTGPLDTDWTAFSDLGGGKFLQPIYAAGLAADNHADNVFNMASGNLRFTGAAAGSSDYPGWAFIEKVLPGTVGDPRVGAAFIGRYYQTSLGVGGFVATEIIGEDPLWNGQFSGLGSVIIESPIVGFNRVIPETNAPVVDILLGKNRWAQIGGFFDGPLAYPTPGFNSGEREDFLVDLYNDFTAGLFTHSALDLNGYGQGTFNVISKAQGAITAGINLSWWWGNAPNAFDGVGIFWTLGNADPPKAIISPRLLTTNVNGAYQLAFWTDPGLGAGPGGPIVTMDWMNGIVLNAPLSQAGSRFVEIVSPLLDFTTPTSVSLPVPIASPAGFVIMASSCRLVSTVKTGTLSTSFTFKSGNDAGHTNLTGTQSPSAAAFSAQTPPSYDAALVVAGFPVSLLDLGTAGNPTLDITVAATGTGGFTWKGYIVVACYIVPSS